MDTLLQCTGSISTSCTITIGKWINVWVLQCTGSISTSCTREEKAFNGRDSCYNVLAVFLPVVPANSTFPMSPRFRLQCTGSISTSCTRPRPPKLQALTVTMYWQYFYQLYLKNYNWRIEILSLQCTGSISTSCTGF